MAMCVLGLASSYSVLAVILLMAALFESFTQPSAILITLMLAFFGAFWSLWIFGYELNPIAFMGIIILIGIVVNNGIVLVDHVNSLRLAGTERRKALIEGCGDRLRPVVMTAITTIFGLLPLALARATVAGAYIDSIAVAVIGGLATSTLFTLLALPVWYTTIEDLGAESVDDGGDQVLPVLEPPDDGFGESGPELGILLTPAPQDEIELVRVPVGLDRPGDAGYLDEDGYIYVMSRTDDVINVAGHRLSTGAMEEVLSGHADVAECAVIGVADKLKGQMPLGLVVLKAGGAQAAADRRVLRGELLLPVRECVD